MLQQPIWRRTIYNTCMLCSSNLCMRADESVPAARRDDRPTDRLSALREEYRLCIVPFVLRRGWRYA